MAVLTIKQYRVFGLRSNELYHPQENDYGNVYDKFPDPFDTEEEAITAIIEKGETFDEHVIQPVFTNLDEDMVSESAEIIHRKEAE